MLAYHVVLFVFLHLALMASSLKNMRVDVKPHPDELRSKRDADKLIEVVSPVRLTGDLHSVSSSRLFRTRRSAESSSYLDNEFHHPVYKIKAFGEDLILILQPDHNLLAPTFTTIFSGNNQTSSKSNLSNLRSCFYKGAVVDKPGSQVVMSICDSMTGSIVTDDYHYSISPVTDKQVRENGVTSYPHLIERRSINRRIKRSINTHRSSCGVNDARHRRRYEQTFKSIVDSRQMDNDHSVRSKRDVENRDEIENVVKFEVENDEAPRLRSKRSFDSKQHYIETMVVADASMVRHHGDDLEHYILSIMMVANRVFSHPSLGSAIALSVVKIMILDDDNEGLRVSTNAAHTLRNFCSWQKQFNVRSDSNPEHYDLAILLTKIDLCGDTCETLGMAEVGAMCSAKRSCAVVEDDGLSASYTVAHEVGHVLNMMHDDNRLCRANFAGDLTTHIMSSTMERVDRDQPWSLCSKQAVIDFLEDERGECLLDQPQKPKVYPTQLPGAMYDINAQCEMAFGKGAIECPYMRECSRLWCQLPRGAHPNQCHTKNFPRADGSPCAPGNHCMRGRCVVKVPERDPVDGNWGSWSQFGSCSRTCGGGIQMSSRQCNSPAPRFGGKYCMGSRQKFRSCRTEACMPRRDGHKIENDFRSEQCARYNGQRFPILGVHIASTWIPKYVDVHPKDRCKLICQSEQTGTYVTLSDRVIDGTRCSPDTTDLCVRGQCMPAGCDGILFSKSKYNKCGLCNTSNKRCRRVRGKYNRKQAGYSDVVKLPAGAATIKIQQKGFRNRIHDGNYLALRNANDKYLLNGDLTLSTLEKDIAVNGTVLQYSGVQVVVEKIYSSMPIKEPITVQVLSLGLSGQKILPPKIKYSYFIPKPQAPRRAQITGSSTGNTNVITRRKLKPDPSAVNDNSAINQHYLTKSTNGKVPRWVTGRWGRCKPYKNRKCGAGWKKRKVTCKIGKDNSNRCKNAVKPSQRQSCFVATCPSVTPIRKSGGLTHSRRNDGPSIVHRFILHNERPIWNAGSWGSCTTSCGLGTKKRHVMCQTRSGRLLDNKKCDPTTRPSKVHGCNLRKCGK